MLLRIKKYSCELEKYWDAFVLENSINGTFLQTRNFLLYHPLESFEDHSLVVYKGTAIIAVIPACEIMKDDKKIFFSHKGSTYGGIVISSFFYDIDHVGSIIETLLEYLSFHGFNHVVLKNTPDIFCKKSMELLTYFLYMYGFDHYCELSSYINLETCPIDIISSFSSSKRRDYKYSEKNYLLLKKLQSKNEIRVFYNVLQNNLKKYNSEPVHSLQELIDFKECRLKDIVDFYAIFFEENIVAESMVFKFEKIVFHTQYLASDQAFLKLYPMNFLITQMIWVAKIEGFKYFSFGISTENHGSILNYGLARFKEGYGADFSINKTFYKEI